MALQQAPRELRDAFAAATPAARNDFLAFIYLMAQRQGATENLTPAPETTTALADFAVRAKLGDAASPEARAQAVVRYFQAHPLDPTLLSALAETIKQSALAGAAGADARQALSFLGAGPAMAAPTVADGKKPRKLALQVAKDFDRDD